ncbi:hypothetical protein BHE74_00023108 [Ensete ventricosum]|nr:hypothetical protein BHE74_00023108 [Ensete ventricosum]
MHIVRSAGFQHTFLRLGQFTHDLARRAHHQRTIGNFLALANQRVGANDAMLADFCAVEDDGVNADKAVIIDGATMQHGVMTDGHAGAQGQRVAHVGVHHAAVLHVAVLADQDQFVVATQHRIEPDVGALLQLDLAHQRGIGGYPAVWVRLDAGVAQAIFHGFSSRRCHSSDGLDIDEAFRWLVQADLGVVIEQVDQFDDHDRRQAPDFVFTEPITGHVPTAALVIDSVGMFAWVLSEEV